MSPLCLQQDAYSAYCPSEHMTRPCQLSWCLHLHNLLTAWILFKLHSKFCTTQMTEIHFYRCFFSLQTETIKPQQTFLKVWRSAFSPTGVHWYYPPFTITEHHAMRAEAAHYLNPERLEDVLQKAHLIHQFIFHLIWGFSCLFILLISIFSETQWAIMLGLLVVSSSQQWPQVDDDFLYKYI